MKTDEGVRVHAVGEVTPGLEAHELIPGPGQKRPEEEVPVEGVALEHPGDLEIDVGLVDLQAFVNGARIRAAMARIQNDEIGATIFHT